MTRTFWAYNPLSFDIPPYGLVSLFRDTDKIDADGPPVSPSSEYASSLYTTFGYEHVRDGNDGTLGWRAFPPVSAIAKQGWSAGIATPIASLSEILRANGGVAGANLAPWLWQHPGVFAACGPQGIPKQSWGMVSQDWPQPVRLHASASDPNVGTTLGHGAYEPWNWRDQSDNAAAFDVQEVADGAWTCLGTVAGKQLAWIAPRGDTRIQPSGLVWDDAVVDLFPASPSSSVVRTVPVPMAQTWEAGATGVEACEPVTVYGATGLAIPAPGVYWIGWNATVVCSPRDRNTADGSPTNGYYHAPSPPRLPMILAGPREVVEDATANATDVTHWTGLVSLLHPANSETLYPDYVPAQTAALPYVGGGDDTALDAAYPLSQSCAAILDAGTVIWLEFAMANSCLVTVGAQTHRPVVRVGQRSLFAIRLGASPYVPHVADWPAATALSGLLSDVFPKSQWQGSRQWKRV